MRPQEIVQLYEREASRLYGGEAVSQLEHALQCATLAEEAGAAPALVAASLLHDVGHLVEGDECAHQDVAADFLRGSFPPEVLEPIRLHVDAKRYLCCTQPGYWDSLSPASKRSLEFQGGTFDHREARRFIERPHARDAVRLRLWDDLAKVAGRATPPLEHFAQALTKSVTSGRAPRWALLWP